MKVTRITMEYSIATSAGKFLVKDLMTSPPFPPKSLKKNLKKIKGPPGTLWDSPITILGPYGPLKGQ